MGEVPLWCCRADSLFPGNLVHSGILPSATVQMVLWCKGAQIRQSRHIRQGIWALTGAILGAKGAETFFEFSVQKGGGGCGRCWRE